MSTKGIRVDITMKRDEKQTKNQALSKQSVNLILLYQQ